MPADRRTPPPKDLTPETRVNLFVALVNAQGGLIEAMRALSLSPEMTRAIFAAIGRQIEAPWPGREPYDRQIAHLYRHYPQSEAMLADCVVRGPGGV